MKISKLIAKLEAVKAKHGDIPVFIEQQGYGGHALHTTEAKDSLQNLTLMTLLHSDQELDEKEIKKIFPEWDGDIDSEQDLKTKYFEISTGTMLYAT